MDSQQLKQIKDKIKREIVEALNQSKLGQMYQNYGLIGNNRIKVECMLDLTRIQFSNTIGDPQVQDGSQLTLDDGLITVDCCPCLPKPCCFCFEQEPRSQNSGIRIN